MLKRCTSIFLTVVLLLGLITVSYASGNEGEEHIKTITAEEYIQLYANNNNITFDEAAEIIKKDNKAVLETYCAENNIITPFYIDYDDGYHDNIGGEEVIIYYVDVYDYLEDRYTSVRYGAFGRVLRDAHSKTFIEGSWIGYSSPTSGLYSFVSPIVTINQESYTRVRIACAGTIEMTYNVAITIGGKITNLIDIGYTVGGDNYVRKFVKDSFREGP